jgi:hypothetical protein
VSLSSPPPTHDTITDCQCRLNHSNVVHQPAHSIARPSRESVRWDGQEREVTRTRKMASEQALSRVSPGQLIPRTRAHNPTVAGSNPAPATRRLWPAHAGQSLYRSRRSSSDASTLGFRSCRGRDELSEYAGGFGLHPTNRDPPDLGEDVSLPGYIALHRVLFPGSPTIGGPVEKLKACNTGSGTSAAVCGSASVSRVDRQDRARNRTEPVKLAS